MSAEEIEGVEGEGQELGDGSEATAAEAVAQGKADLEGREASQTESGEPEEFEYETPDGKTVILNKEQADAVQTLLDADERAEKAEARVKELEAKPPETKEEKPAEKPGEAAEGEVTPVNWDVVGDELTTMMEEGRTKDIGVGLQNIINREVLTSPYVEKKMVETIVKVFEHWQAQAAAETEFKGVVGDEIPASEVKQFRASHKGIQTDREAVLAIKASRLEKQLADLQSGKKVEVAKAKKDGEKEAIIRAKARGTLRPVSGNKGGVRPGGANDLKKGVDLSDPDQRTSAAAKFIERRRASGVVD